MLDLAETFVYDAVTHAYNLAPSNYRNERHAAGITEMIYGTGEAAAPPGTRITREGYVRDWQPAETANMLFLESETDMATFHPTPLYAFHDGLVATEKAAAVAEEWPDRFHVYATIDPLRDGALEELARQVEAFDPVGLKLYPSHWEADAHEGWSMGDPDVAFPVFERAAELGLDLIDVHKAIPFGPVPRSPYDPSDVDEAAESFPDLTFSIVHGGYAFAEETAWQIARFPNVYANLEGVPPILLHNEQRFAELFGELVSVGGEEAFEKLLWSSSAMAVHPRPQLEAFRDFEFPEDVRKNTSRSGDLPRLTDDRKRKILGENYAELLGLDVEAASARVDGDAFDERVEREGLAEPYATTEAADEVVPSDD